MGELINFPKALWALSEAAQCVLLGVLIARKAYRDYPAFTFYVLATLLQNAVVFIVSSFFDLSPFSIWCISWGMQGFVLCIRALAVAEVARHFLGHFRGIWALARRILLGCAAVVMLYSLVISKHQWNLVILNADRGLELAFAAVIVTLFLFVRYYGLVVESRPRWMAMGFFSYSCFFVLNNTILERWLDNYLSLWNLLGTWVFLAALLLWTWTFRNYQPVAISVHELLPTGVYHDLSPILNLRLRLLNDRLIQFWHVEARRP
jgi:hypothetical protein